RARAPPSGAVRADARELRDLRAAEQTALLTPRDHGAPRGYPDWCAPSSCHRVARLPPTGSREAGGESLLNYTTRPSRATPLASRVRAVVPSRIAPAGGTGFPPPENIARER